MCPQVSHQNLSLNRDRGDFFTGFLPFHFFAELWCRPPIRNRLSQFVSCMQYNVPFGFTTNSLENSRSAECAKLFLLAGMVVC